MWAEAARSAGSVRTHISGDYRILRGKTQTRFSAVFRSMLVIVLAASFVIYKHIYALMANACNVVYIYRRYIGKQWKALVAA